MKKVWIGALVLALTVVAGVVWGPRIWYRLSAPDTPLGRIESVKAVDPFPDSPSVVQLWLVSFSGPGRRFGRETGPRTPHLLDETGTSYLPTTTLVGETKAEVFFTLPQGRTPRSIRFGDAAPVPLPSPAATTNQ